MTFAFSGGSIGRDISHVEDTEGFDACLRRADALVLPMWHGKPLMRTPKSLCWLSPAHRMLRHRSCIVYLGSAGAAPRFAAAIPDWQGAPARKSEAGAMFERGFQPHPLTPDMAGFVNLRQVMAGLCAEDSELAVTARGLLGWHSSHKFCSACAQPTDILSGGWRRYCRGCGNESFCPLSPVVIMLVIHEDSLLLGRSNHWPGKMHSLLAGFIEPGETVEAAIRRETFEETGIAVGDVRYVASQPWPFPASLMLGFLAHARHRRLRIDHNELASALWVSRRRMQAILQREDADIHPPRTGSIANFLIRRWVAGKLS
ncbi:MAG: NAD(+) diphosphatase [Rhodobacteraceae bacterium]|nr:NAD(+) diphosphatase [Paracoccaceae bacterium]